MKEEPEESKENSFASSTESNSKNAKLPYEELDRLFRRIRYEGRAVEHGALNPINQEIDRVFQILFPRLFSIAHSRLAGYLLPEDLQVTVQTLVSNELTDFLIEYLPSERFQYRGAHKAVGYVSMMTSNRAKNIRTAVCRNPAVRISMLDEEGRTYPPELIAESEQLDRIEQSDLPIAKLLGKLTEEQRKVTFLTFWEGLNAMEIADLIRRTPAQVRVIRSRALTKLRSFFRRGHDGEWWIEGL